MMLTPKLRLKLTRLLVFFSLALSIVSYLTVVNGIGEVYPFFFWKLYTQPLGNSHSFGEYRIYYRNNGESSWNRQRIAPTPTFTQDEYVYTFNYLVSQQLNAAPSDTLASHKLLAFIRHVAPAADRYKIVLEQYAPKEIMQNPLAYDTTTVISF